jgi:hypothetical protein
MIKAKEAHYIYILNIVKIGEGVGFKLREVRINIQSKLGAKLSI